MARSAQKRRPRKPAASAVPAKKARKPERPAYEQQMFFPRLIKQAKWVFVFLALAFAVGFVAFGVGGNIPGTGISDILQGGGGTSAGPSVGEARDEVEDNPNDPAAHKDLGDALLADGRGDEAIVAYEEYLDLRPRDAETKRTLAGLYMSRANTARDQYAQIYGEYQSQTGAGLFGPPTESQFGRSLTGKIDSELQTIYGRRLSEINQRMQAAFGSAATLYQQIAATRPDDEALLQLQLGDAAYQAQRIPQAVKAYQRYLKLDPDGREAPYARQQIRLLQSGGANSQAQPG